ncbi:MAG: hypothetical protein KDB97_09465, partial [Flavobacteriales bacterium]|nr:hypothetical protein [Flavobacteriales bacterium]
MNCRNSKGPRRAWTWLTAGLFGAVLALGGSDIQAQTIWDGGSLNFTNTPGGGEQDAIAAQTSLTRDASGPIYNTICEGSPGGAGCGYLGPCNTEWAIGTIANWNTYTYDTWVNTNGCAPPTMVGQAWVCHLIAEDIYLQVNWTGWGSGGSGGFTYNRTTMPLVACDNTLNGGQYPSSAVPAGAESVVTTIATCSFEQEYSDITGITAGRDYEFTTSTGGYITVYEGTSNGTLLGAGYSPLTVTAGTGADLFAHWSVDNTCATAANCITTTVELLPIPPSSCTNTSQYPSSAVTPNGETVTQISGCSYEEEYSIITGVQAGRDYEFTISTGDYITVYQTFNGGTLLGAGYSPLTVTAGNADNMFANWTVDDQCTTTTGCVTTTVQMLPLPPCDNSPNQYPGGAITPLPDGSVTTISTCSYLEEFSQITGIAGGTDYIFDIDGGAGYYITVRSGTSSGAVVGVGFAPLTVTAPDGNDLFAHWTLDATCATQTNICHTTTVQLVLLCTPPTATATISPDCSNGQYTVEVDLTDLGNASSVDITSDVNGVEHAAVTTTGIYTMGPYPSGTPATITVVHNDDALCNLGLGTQSYTCPVVISSFPYCEDFEGLTNCTSTCLGAPCASTFTAVDWQQGSGNGDNANWGLNNGQTPSFTTTGPTVDYVPGTSAGKYVYLESSSPCFPTGVADLLSPAFDISGMTSTNGYRTSFAWHMYGQSMGTMELAVSEDGGPWTPLFTMSGDQGNVWNTFSVDRPLGASQVQYRMRGIVGTNFYSDMAWDYFCVSEAPLCTPPMATASVDATNCPDFNVDVDITDLGDATDVNISYTVNGGTPIDIGPFGTGIQSLGPFTYPDVVNVTVVHNGDAACNLPLGNFSGPALCNDYCTGATPISCATVQLTGTNVGATADGVPSQASGGEATVDNGVWYVFAGDDSQVTLQTCDAGTTFDTRLHVFSGACGSLVGVTGNDDNCGTRSLVVFNAYNGTDYYIAVEGYGTSSGTFVLDIACAALCVPVPTNDDCANAETLTPGSGCTSVPGSTNCANTSAGTNPSCISTFATAPDVFYSFTAGDATQILNFLNVTAANLGYALYDACGGAQITCNAGVVDGADNVLSGLTTGNVYVLRVFSLVGQEGDFDICIKNPCQPPAGLVTPTYYDCASATPGQTDVTVDVTGVGSDPLVDIEINGTVVMSDVGVGTYGPFSYPSGTAVTVVLVTDDSFCDQTYGPFINASNCVTCDGPVLNYSFCYPNNMNQDWLYESDGGGGNFSINFISGSIESSSFDHLTIYDGPDNTYPVLYDHTITATEDLAGLLVTATGNSLFMHATSDASFSCSDNLIPGPWVWQVYCLSCDFPVGNTSNTQVDCLTGTYTVDVDVTDLGDAPDVDIVSDLNGLEQNDVGLGTYTVGPFPTGTPVNITLVHNGNNACDITLPTVNPSSNCIACDNSVLNQSYCYVNNDSHNWSYTSDGNGTLILSFQSGSIESSSFEHLTIYDGPDNSGSILFDHTTFATVDLAGLLVVASGNSLYMEMTSDASFSCDDGLIPGPWNWTVQCVDCTFPVASAAVIENCGGGDFTIQVDVTDASNAGTVNITTDYLGDAEPTGVGTGTYVLGPYPSGSIVNLQVAHSSNPICTLDLGDFKDCCNGVCSGATAAVVGTNTTPALDCGAGASNLGTDEYGASTGGTNARWFYWDAPGNGTLEVTSCPSGVDTRVKIHNGNAGCGSLNPVAANDDACFPSSTAGTFVTPGDHMLIEWDDRWSSNGFDWDLNFTACTPDPNLDLCSTQDPTAHQVSIGSGQTWTGTLDCLSPDDIVPNPYSSTYGWGWAAFELTECANVTIDYCGTASFGFGSLNMYGDCGTIYINSQSYDFSTCGDGNPTIFFNNLTPGFYYYPILWSPPNNAVGPFQVNVNAFAPSIACPTNLTACAATPVVCNDVVTGSTDNLFPSLPANACPFPNGATSGGSLWYSYTATQDENVILSTCGAATTFDTRISVFDGVDCNTLSCYTLGDDKGGACTNRTQIEFFAQ